MSILFESEFTRLPDDNESFSAEISLCARDRKHNTLKGPHSALIKDHKTTLAGTLSFLPHSEEPVSCTARVCLYNTQKQDEAFETNGRRAIGRGITKKGDKSSGRADPVITFCHPWSFDIDRINVFVTSGNARVQFQFVVTLDLKYANGKTLSSRYISRPFMIFTKKSSVDAFMTTTSSTREGDSVCMPTTTSFPAMPDFKHTRQVSKSSSQKSPKAGNESTTRCRKNLEEEQEERRDSSKITLSPYRLRSAKRQNRNHPYAPRVGDDKNLELDEDDDDCPAEHTPPMTNGVSEEELLDAPQESEGQEEVAAASLSALENVVIDQRLKISQLQQQLEDLKKVMAALGNEPNLEALLHSNSGILSSDPALEDESPNSSWFECLQPFGFACGHTAMVSDKAFELEH